MGDKHPRCPHCLGLLKHDPADILGPERVKCILCGWEKHRDKPRPALRPDPLTTITAVDTIHLNQKMETTMTTTTKRGFCPSCKREDVLLPGPKCSRCYDRIKKGLDVITGAPVPPLRAHDFVDPAASKPAPAASVPKARPEAKPAQAGCNIDIVAALDEAWSFKRANIITQLQSAEKTQERLSIAYRYVSSIDCI